MLRSATRLHRRRHALLLVSLLALVGLAGGAASATTTVKAKQAAVRKVAKKKTTKKKKKTTATRMTTTVAPTTSTTVADLEGTITVFAATSLTDAFTDMGKRFQGAHPGVKVTFSFAASSTLATQVNQGAPADVLATADEESMQVTTKAGTTGNPERFARNIVEIIVAKGNPKAVTGIKDLDRVSYVLCDPAVPCGKYAALALKKNNMTSHPKSLETNVRNVVARVTSGEADAGIVYHTDVVAQKGNAVGVTISNADDPDLQNIYPVAVTKDAKNKAVAKAWKDYVTSDAGQQVLASYEFLPAPR